MPTTQNNAVRIYMGWKLLVFRLVLGESRNRKRNARDDWHRRLHWITFSRFPLYGSLLQNFL